MKIIFLSGDFPPQSFGGAGISTYKIALGMKDVGHDVYAITTCREKMNAGFFEYNGIKVFRIQSNYNPRWRAWLSLYNPSVIREVKEIFKKVEPDVVHANNIHFHLSYHCLKIAKKYAKVVVWTARDVMSFNYGKLQSKKYLDTFDYRVTWKEQIKQAKKRWNPFRNFIIRQYLKCPDKLFAVSDALRDALAQNGIKGVETVHTGVSPEAWHTTPEERNTFREKWNVADKKVILFGGRLSESKGGDKTLQALLEIVKKVPEAVILVAGKIDTYSEHMKKEAEKLGLHDKLVFAGWMGEDEIKYAFAASDVVLVPSVCFDSLPRIVLEAMASGKPVIGTCYGGAREAIVEGVTGYVIDPRDTHDMAAKITDLLTNPEKIKKFGEEGMEKIKKDFNLNTMIQKTIHEYDMILTQKNEH